MKFAVTKMPFVLFFVICSSSTIITFGGDAKFNCKNIPANLLIDAKSILREKNISFEVLSRKKAYETVSYAVTIFNKEEREKGVLVLYYDKFKKLDDLEGYIYDANGKEIRELESSEIKDYSTTGSYTLYTDSRVKVAELYYDTYPYTVEYKFKFYYKGYLDWPEWTSQQSLEPVEHSGFEVIIDKDQELRYWCNSDSLKPTVTVSESQKKYLWQANNLPKLSKDIVGEDEEDYAGIVKIAPDEFEIDGFEGKMSSWKEFGNWIARLYKGKDKLPDDAKKDIAELIKPDDDTLTKIKKLYEYMQKRTRYASIQLGIGGWMPFDAAYVHARGYGDCKALVNYMQALLNEAGITSYPVLIYNGQHAEPIRLEMPCNQFNHVILNVPLKKDTLWLECTSQTIPIGLIHSGIINRYALLIAENGSKIVHTPAASPQDNLQIRNSTVNLTPGGNASAHSVTCLKGIPQDDFIDMCSSTSPEEREKWIQNHIDIPNLNLSNYKIYGVEAPSGDVKLDVQLELPQYASISGSRIFFLPNLMERRKYTPPDIKKRLSPIKFGYPYQDIDTVVFNIPENYSSEALPQEVKLESSFARFHSKSVLTGNKIIYMRSLEIFSCTVPAVNYAEYRNFFAAVVKADKAQVVLVKTNKDAVNN